MIRYSFFETEALRDREATAADCHRIREELLSNPDLRACFEDGSLIEVGDTPEPLERSLSRACLVLPQRSRLLPTFRIRQVRDLLITTDFPIQLRDRVFPWGDEAELIIDMIEALYRPRNPPRGILNMCSGTGMIALWLARRYPTETVTAVDIQSRARSVGKFNLQLNFAQLDEDITPSVKFITSDLFKYAAEGPIKYDLIIADPPFALQPPRWPEQSHSAGGKFGDNVITNLLAQVRMHLKPGGRFFCLAYSVGTEDQPTRLLDKVEEFLCEPGEDPRRKVKVLEGEKVWRFLEKKRIPSPMPLPYLAIRVGDPTYRQHERAPDVDEYIDWIEGTLMNKKKGYTHLHYALIDHTEPEK